MGQLTVIVSCAILIVGFQNCSQSRFNSEVQDFSSTTLESSSMSLGQSPSSSGAPIIHNHSSTQSTVAVPTANFNSATSMTTTSAPMAAAPAAPTASSATMAAPPSSQNTGAPNSSASTSVTSAAAMGSSAPAEPVWLLTSFQIEYGAPMKPLGVMNYQTNQGLLLEAGNRTLLKDTNREAYYSDIVGNGWLVIEDPEKVSPTRVTVIECQRDAINTCRTHNVNPNDLAWSMAGGENTSLLHSSFMCINTGQSVAEKRGLIDCGAQGAGAFMISDKDPSRFPASMNMPTRGTLWSSNTRAFASGKFKVIATILPTTPELGKFAGRSGEYEVTIKNRMDLHLTVNTGSIFESYGIPLVSVNFVSSEGLADGVTYKSINCNAMASTGESIVMEQRAYENRFSFKRAPASLPSGTTVKVSCSAATYDGQSASVAFEQTK